MKSDTKSPLSPSRYLTVLIRQTWNAFT